MNPLRFRQVLEELENACEAVAATRPQAAYDAMIEGGQEQVLLDLDRARARVRRLLEETV